MGGFYKSEFKCNNCNYSETLQTAPKTIKPINDNLEAVIQYRWCNNCSGIRSVFTGIGLEYSVSSMDNPDRKSWMDDTDINKLTKQKETYKKRLEFLIEDKSQLKLNFVQNIFKNIYTKKFDAHIKATTNNIIKVDKKINKYKKSIETAVNLTKKAKEFYNSKNIVPKCLCCGSVDVSLVSFENQNHICDGTIIERDLGRGGSTGEFTELVYDQFGNSKANVFTLSFLEPQRLLRKLEKPYFI